MNNIIICILNLIFDTYFFIYNIFNKEKIKLDFGCQLFNIEEITNQEWGSTKESNIKTMQYAGYSCHNKDSIFIKDKLDKTVQKTKHYAMLEHTNVELLVNIEPSQLSKYFEIKENTIISGPIYEIRNTLPRVNCTKIEYWEPGLYIGSLRDLFERDLLDDNMNIKQLNNVVNVSGKLSLFNPLKRRSFLVTINKDLGHKLRTQRSISQLSTSGTHTFEKYTVCYHQYPIDNTIYEIDILTFKMSAFLQKILSNLLSIIKSKYISKRIKTDNRIDTRIMSGTNQDFLNMIEARLCSPKYKEDVLYFCEKLKERIRVEK